MGNKGTAAGCRNKKGVIFRGCCPESSTGEEVIPSFVLGGAWSLGIGAGGRVNMAGSLSLAISTCVAGADTPTVGGAKSTWYPLVFDGASELGYRARVDGCQWRVDAL